MCKMVVLANTNILAVGIGEKSNVLRELKLNIFSLTFGKEAARSLKTKNFHSVISRWNLLDMPQGRFLKGLKSFRPDIPTIAIIEAGDTSQEIAARSLGVSAVVPDDGDDGYLCQIVSQLMGLNTNKEIEALCAYRNS